MKTVKIMLANLLIVVVVYSNVAVILNYPLGQITPRFSLPINRHQDQLFILFGVFSSYETMNRDIEIYGITPPTAWASSFIIAMYLCSSFSSS